MSGVVAESDRPSQRADRLVVLVLEQDAEVVRSLSETVAGQPITLSPCSDAAEALLVLGRLRPDAALVGPVCGRLDAVDFIRVARTDDPALPIIAGAGRETSEFAASATAAGATAVLPRPYRAAELLALLRSLARSESLALRPPPIDVGRLRVDGAIPQIWIDGKQVTLPPMEYLLLRYFADRVGQVLSRAELIDAVWGEAQQQASSNTLTVHIMRLRRRLGTGDGDGDGEWIRSVRGLGYQFTVPPAPGDSAARGEVPAQR